MRPFAFALAIPALALFAACGGGGGAVQDDPKPAAAANFPTGYTAWTKINDAPIVREEEGIVREIYAKNAGGPDNGGLGPGTVLVKERYAAFGGEKGALKLISVMRRDPSSAHGGWAFEAYDPTTKAAIDDTAGCIGCHSLRSDAGFLFGDAANYSGAR